MSSRVAVIIYSLYGHVAKLAEHVKKGVDASGVATATIYRVAETLPKDVLDKMHASNCLDKYPVASPSTLEECDGVLFGVPTRFGNVPAQVRALFDATGQLWFTKKLVGKPAGFFFATASQHGGQETTVFSTLPFLAHHGMIFVPLGFTHDALNEYSQIHGGSAWGAGTITQSDGKRMPSDSELALAEHQGKSFAKVVEKLKK